MVDTRVQQLSKLCKQRFGSMPPSLHAQFASLGSLADCVALETLVSVLQYAETVGRALPEIRLAHPA